MSDIEAPRRGRPPNQERTPLRDNNERVPLRDRLRDTKRTFKTNDSRHDIPQEIIDRNQGVSFEWKRHTCKGEEYPFYIAGMRRQGWEPVDASDVPELVPEGFTGSVIVDGQLLMARRQELTDQARAEVKRLSDAQIAERNKANGVAPSGQAPRLSPQEFGRFKGDPGRQGGVVNEVMRPIPVEE